jgi:HK97 family phage major capsid protein
MSLRAQAQKLREKRVGLVAQARKLTDAAEKEGRELRAEDNEQFDNIMREVDGLKERIDKMERMAKAEDDSRDGDDDDDRDDDDDDDDDKDKDKSRGPGSSGPPDGPIEPNKDPDEPDRSRRSRRQRATPGRDQRSAANPTVERRAGEHEHEYRDRVRRSTREYRRVFGDYIVEGNAALMTTRAQRAIQADADIVGGFLVAPQEFHADLIKFVDNLLWIRQFATKHTVKAAQSLGAPSLDVDISDADWTSELNTGNEDTAMAFGKRELNPHPLAKRIKVSNKLLRMASVTGGYSADGSVKGGGAEGLVRARLAYKFAVTEEKGFMTGSGAQQPLGLFTASSRGISTGRDVNTGSATGFTADGLIAAKYNQKAQYWSRLRWLFHRSALQLIRQLKDGNGQYLWVPGGFGGEADKLLDCPVMMSEYAPATFTTGQYVGLLGDFSFYWIADSETIQIQRLMELYAASNQTGFIARMELDGMPVLEEAFTRLKTN